MSLLRAVAFAAATAACATAAATELGAERAAVHRLADGEEYSLSTRELIDVGRQFFAAACTSEEGGGRPLTRGTGAPLGDMSRQADGSYDASRVEGLPAVSLASDPPIEERFVEVGCSGCHRPWLELRDTRFTEPNPYNPPGNLQPEDVGYPLLLDLNDKSLPGARLRARKNGVTRVRPSRT